jgi:hypothetical protein
MKQEVAIAGSDLRTLVALAVTLGDAFGSVSLAESPRPVDDLALHPRPEASVIVIFLTGKENVGDLLSMFRVHPGIPFLLLARSYPPDGAVARVVTQYRGAILPAHASPLVVIATLIALLSGLGARALS